MYGVSEKKVRVEADTEAVTSDAGEEEDQNNESCAALDILTDALDAEEDDKRHTSLEESSQEESIISRLESHKSKNPFLKVQSPKKGKSLPAGQFSALKRFNNIRKTVVDTDTLVKSRSVLKNILPKACFFTFISRFFFFFFFFFFFNEDRCRHRPCR